jgi:hypothetical protein
MSERGALEAVVGEVGKLLLPLRSATASPEAFESLLLELGWDAGVIPQPINALTPDIEILFDRLQKILGSGLSADASANAGGAEAEIDVPLSEVLDAIEAVARLVDGIADLASAPNSAFPAELNADNFKGTFPEQLLSYLFATYLEQHQPRLGQMLRAFGVINRQDVEAAGNRPGHTRIRFSFSSIPGIFSDPGVIFQNAFNWGSDDFDFEEVTLVLDDLFSAFGLATFYEPFDTEAALALEDGAVIEGNPERRRLRGRFFEYARNASTLTADIGMFPLPKVGARKPGVALLPAFSGALNLRMELGPTIAVTFAADVDLAGGVGVIVRPNEGIELILGFESDSAPTSAKGSGKVSIDYAPNATEPTIILGNRDGMRLEFGSAGGAGGFLLDADGKVDVFVEAETEGLAFVLDGSGSDGFLSTILSGINGRFEADLGLGVSVANGVYFRGTSHLEIQLPAHIDLGAVEIQGLTIAVTPSGAGLPIDVGTTFKAKLGPLDAVVENIGLRTDLAFPGEGGNLGPIDLDFGIKPPNGVGLSLDAGPVKGGGYLFFDPDRGESAGALELRILDFLNVTAIGIITTKMPDGSDGFSFLALINVEFNPGVQLGFGFTLIGVGGLVGLSRSMDLDALVDGARSGSLENLLFPQDVVANAPSIISDLKQFFPIEVDTFLVGPMVKFGWGTPTLISLSMGIIIEIPGNVAIVGKLVVAIPDENVPLIIIKVAFMGAIEFDKKRGWFFANLYDSRVVFMTLEGGMGVLAAFGSDSNFIVTVGGFHPAYNPPSLPFSDIRRITINILNTPVARIRVMAYFAVTSNTVQFGARAELYFGISIARIEGHLAFDALFQFSPFYFIITISASLSVKLFGAGLFSVRFRGSLEGTSPWHVEGTGSISILFWDVDVDFSHTWGEDEDTKLPPISVMPLLAAEFAKVENWTAELANQELLSVSLAPRPGVGELVLHPVGTLRISQRAVPLNIEIDKLGAQRPDDANRFDIKVKTAGIEKRDDIREDFATAQFQELSDSDKLKAQDFEKEDAGLELSLTGPQANTSFVAKRIARYEQIIIDNNFKRGRFRFLPLLAGLFTHFLAGNAMARSANSARSKSLARPFDEKVKLRTTGYVVVNLADNSALESQPASFGSRARAEQAIKDEVAANPKLADQIHVVRAHEVKEAA